MSGRGFRDHEDSVNRDGASRRIGRRYDAITTPYNWIA
jgi:hypothetical protein